MAVHRMGTVNLARLIKWDAARRRAARLYIDKMNLDVIAFQETTETFEDDLIKDWGGKYVVVADHVNCPLAVRKGKYRTVELNGATNKDLVMPGSVRKRYGSAACIQDVILGDIFIVVTMHPSNVRESRHSAADRIRQARYTRDVINHWNTPGHPVVILGDMNDREVSPQGIPGVFVKDGYTDFLRALDQPITIDRGFGRKVKVTKTWKQLVPRTVSDHDFRGFLVEIGKVAVTDSLEALFKKRPVTQVSLTKVQAARSGKHLSKYTAIVQDWLGVPVTGRWDSKTQRAYDKFRKDLGWSDYKGGPGLHSLTLIRHAAKKRGGLKYAAFPVVK